MVETPEGQGSAQVELVAGKPSRARMAASCSAAAGIGLTVPVSQHLHVGGPMAGALFWLWFLGPVVAGAILQRREFFPYLVPAVVWYGVLLLAMWSGWMAPESVENATDFDPTAAVVYLVGALPFVTVPAASVSFVAGNAVLRLRARPHAT